MRACVRVCVHVNVSERASGRLRVCVCIRGCVCPFNQVLAFVNGNFETQFFTDKIFSGYHE